MCQQIPASKASKEEAMFGRELAAWSLNRRGQLRARAGKTDEARADFDLAIRVDSKLKTTRLLLKKIAFQETTKK